jgi:hypothetical protein
MSVSSFLLSSFWDQSEEEPTPVLKQFALPSVIYGDTGYHSYVTYAAPVLMDKS